MQDFLSKKTGMRAVVVACYGSYFFYERVEYAYRALTNYGYETKVLMSDFDHLTKSTIPSGRYPAYVELLSTRPYYKNVSIARILSHLGFAKAVEQRLSETAPDFIYFLLPPNTIPYVIGRYKRRHKECVVVADVMDLWPESFPVPGFNKSINVFAKAWRWLRSNGLRVADGVVMECGLYRSRLSKWLPEYQRVIYLPAKVFPTIENKSETNDWLNIAYIGQVSKLIDIDKCLAILDILARRYKVIVHVIGTGANYQSFIERLQGTVQSVRPYGPIYDTEQVAKIFAPCQLGLNIMKDSVSVGLTMKSMTYIGLGLPMLNNIKGDTWQLIEQYKAGCNIGDLRSFEEKIQEENLNMMEQTVIWRTGVAEMRAEHFSAVAVQDKFNRAVEGASVMAIDKTFNEMCDNNTDKYNRFSELSA